ncbi:hypothetical protein CLV46_1627 [Diaminobutyricimonas aerilata]|uniref:Uncharacterized protein n=1 Tax=Diaminobutyricimonas aerilata TaxID=1162967 RepID=A0A2M9CJK4_9MICO|nr:hypothetical protein [Diaminobutyricimonas aerilata]PJJ72065.1 hypothetical protein CLV46_1627 [Diaminobutyricimonas aerilata]
MRATIDRVPAEALVTLPGGRVLRRVRRLLIWTFGAGWFYWTFTGGSASWCAGGLAGDGGYIDAAGNPTSDVPVCHSLTLSPTIFVVAAFAIAVVWSISTALRRAATEAEAIRYLDRAAAFVGITAGVSVIVAHVWFWTVPIEQIGVGTVYFPFPFASGNVESDPMPQP